jgi:hypothetical protein
VILLCLAIYSRHHGSLGRFSLRANSLLGAGRVRLAWSVRSNQKKNRLSTPRDHAVLAALAFSAGVQRTDSDYESNQQDIRGFVLYGISPRIPALFATNSGAPGYLGKCSTVFFQKGSTRTSPLLIVYGCSLRMYLTWQEVCLSPCLNNFRASVRCKP